MIGRRSEVRRTSIPLLGEEGNANAHVQLHGMRPIISSP